jgi:type II secretory pathway pseudopilin PulG
MFSSSAKSRSCPPAARRPGERRRNPIAGFTIVEVGVAALILVLCISGSLVTLQRGFVAIDNARYTTLAGQILQSQMEKLRLLTWTQLSATSSGSFTTDLDTSTSGQLANFTSLTQTISDAPSPFNGTAKDITLTATWKGTDGRTRTLSYYTRYAKNGISDFFYTTH